MDERHDSGQLVAEQRIVDLPRVVEHLPDEIHSAFDRLFHVSETFGQIDPPEHMHRWIERYFGSVDAVLNQHVVKVTNRHTLEATLFNDLRSRRPLEARIPADLADEIAKTAPDPFCEPLHNTPADVFGRIEGKHSLTAGNIAKYDGFHGVVIFREHDPLAFTGEVVEDAVSVSREWIQKCYEQDNEAIYPLFMWNCLWKSGASIPHGHAQVSLSRGMHYGKVEHQRRSAVAYRNQHQRNYFDDLFAVHEGLGIGRIMGNVRVMANLTPLKEKEVVLIASKVDTELSAMIYRVLRCLIEDLNSSSFNLAIWERPIVETDEDWSDMPVVVRIVDRGDPLNRTSDFGAMELYAASVVSSDPFRVADTLWAGIE
jgi:galactose-1-phosphate uridylyltransferase